MNRTGRALKSFYEDVGECYPEEDEVYSTLRGQLRKKFVLSYLKKFTGRLLDIGCNRGMYLAAYTGGSRFGVDISISVLKKAHKSAPLNLCVADAERLQCFRPACFDFILCSEVLEHCLNPEDVFRGIARLLQSGGRALLTTPNWRKNRPRWISLGPLEFFGVRSALEEGYYHTAYQPVELEKMAIDAGLTILESGTLEREVKYAAKIPAVFFILGRLVNKIVNSDRFSRINELFFHRSTQWIYQICRITKLEFILLKFINDGVRSFVFIEKTK